MEKKADKHPYEEKEKMKSMDYFSEPKNRGRENYNLLESLNYKQTYLLLLFKS